MATIRQIAERAGVSAAAVSRILNGDKTLSVTEQTRKRVIEAAASLGYVKKERKARCALRFGILQWFSAEQEMRDDYYLMIRKGIEDFCETNSIAIERRYRSDPDYGRGLEDVDGLICIGKFSQDEALSLKGICGNIIFADMTSDRSDLTTISMDFRSAARDALSCLCDLGHRKIAFVGGIEYQTGQGGKRILDPRKEAYLSFMEEKGLGKEAIVKEGEFTIESGYEKTRELLDEGRDFSAIFAANDAMAIGALRALKDRSFVLPRDYSVIGINDSQMSRFTDPELTTMRASSYEMGQFAADIVYMANNTGIKAPLKIEMPLELIRRGSCGRYKGD